MGVTIYYILIVLAALGCAVNFALTKVYQIKQGNTMETGVVFNCLVGLVGTILYFAICGFKVEVTFFSFVMALLSTLFVGLYTMVGFKIMSIGSVAIYTIFLMLGGMILPYFYGLVFLDEKITVMKVVALVIMTIAIILQGSGDKKKGKALFYILCIAVFILNGGTSIVSKIHQIDAGYRVVSTNGFVLLKNIMMFVLYGAMIPFVSKDKKKAFAIRPVIYLVIVLSALISSVSYMFQLVCSIYLPATVQFPVMSGGTIVFTALLGLMCFKEGINKRQMLSLILCVVSSFLFIV